MTAESSSQALKLGLPSTNVADKEDAAQAGDYCDRLTKLPIY